MAQPRLAAVIVVLTAGGACSSGTSPPPVPDAAVDADVEPADSGVPGLVIAEPAPPVLTPCPAGWRELAADGEPTVCEPWPSAGATDCTDGEAHYPGTDGCAPVGRPCSGGDFPADLPTDRPIVYVLAGSTSGDGSAMRPFGTIAEALVAAPAGGVVAIGRGTYDEPIAVRSALSLRGVCAAETQLRSSVAFSGLPVVDVAADGAELADLSIVDSPRFGLGLRPGVTARIDGVAVVGATGIGILVSSGAVLEGTNLLVRGTRSTGSALDDAGLGIASDGAQVTVTRFALERNHRMAALAINAGSITLEDGVVRDTESPVGGTLGYSLAVLGSRSRAEVRRAALERGVEFGVFARGDAASVLLEDVVLRETGTVVIAGMPWRGRGLIAFEGAGAVLRRVLVERNHQKSLQVRDVGSSLVLEDVVVRDTLPLSEPSGLLAGMGLHVLFGAEASVTRAVFARSVMLGIALDSGGSDTPPHNRATLEDVVVRDTVGGGHFGARAIQVVDQGSLSASRLRLTNNLALGILVGGAASTAVLRDVSVDETTAIDCPLGSCFGTAVIALTDAMVDMERFRIERSALCGIHVARNGSLDVRDGIVMRNTFGACVQVDGYDLRRLMSGVSYSENETNLETDTLPVPPDPLVAM